MGNKGNNRHLKGLAAPPYLAVHRKEQSYVAKANPGRHNLQRSIPLTIVLKKLTLADTSSEASKIIKNGLVLINNKVIREPKYPIGLNDVIELKELKKSYQIGINDHAQVSFEEMKKVDYDSHVYKVVGKYKTAKGKIMVRLHDGSTSVAKNDVHVNDSVIVDAKGAIKKTLALNVGAECLIIDGVHVGKNGKISSMKKGTMNISSSAVIKPKSGDEFETIINNIMVTG